MNILKIAGLAVLLAASTSGWGQTYYKWIDEEGTTHFTPTPPPEGDYETVDTTTSVVTRSAPAAPAADAEADEADPASEVRMPREGEPDPAEIAARCAQAEENLYWLQNRRRIQVERDDGSTEMVEGDDREAMIAETQAFIDEWCSGDDG